MVSKYIEQLVTPRESNVYVDLSGQSEKIIAHPITKKAAIFYEKLRGLLDYQEEAQIRRRIIERIIKRKFLFNGQLDIGKSILEELVGAGYLPNDAVPESKAKEIQIIVDRYKDVFLNTAHPQQGFNSWTTAMAAVEVNELLFPRPYEMSAYEMFVSILKDKVVFSGDISKERKENICTLAAARVFLEASSEEQLYILWKRFSANNNFNALQMKRFFEKSKLFLEDPVIWTLASKIKDLGVAVKLLHQYSEEYQGTGSEAFEDRQAITERFRSYMSEHYKKEKEYVKKNGVRAVIYLLCTKVLLALIIEIPIDLWLSGSILFFALFVNIAFHPLLLLTLTRKSLGFSNKNTDKAIAIAFVIIEGSIETIQIKTKTKASYEMFYYFLYGLMYVFVFSIIISLLIVMRFNLISMLLFLVFLALVSYFAVRIRGHALRWRVWIGKEKMITILGNLFMLPIIRLGRWLSVKFSSINAFVFVMDFIIETPFKIVLKIINDFLYFLQDKKEDVF